MPTWYAIFGFLSKFIWAIERAVGCVPIWLWRNTMNDRLFPKRLFFCVLLIFFFSSLSLSLCVPLPIQRSSFISHKNWNSMIYACRRGFSRFSFVLLSLDFSLISVIHINKDICRILCREILTCVRLLLFHSVAVYNSVQFWITSESQSMREKTINLTKIKQKHTTNLQESSPSTTTTTTKTNTRDANGQKKI